MTAAARTLHTRDRLALVAEVAHSEVAGPVRAAAVLCHPHPEYGGTMRSIVISALFEALPALGCTCLRFEFRGVGGSEGSSSGGADEPRDVVAAIEALAGEVATPLVLVGWSFGADMALSVLDDRVAGWVAIAPPLHYRPSFDAVAADGRPKDLVLGEHDEFRAPEDIRNATSAWVNTTIEVVPGASHFFVGCTDRVVDAVWAGVRRAVG